MSKADQARQVLPMVLDGEVACCFRRDLNRLSRSEDIQRQSRAGQMIDMHITYCNDDMYRFILWKTIL
jgi:hypothetical protein